MLKQNPDPRIRTYAVWVPMQGGTEKHVPEATATMPDPRVQHFWDGDKFAMTAFSPVLQLPPGREAWDLYLIYGPGRRWDETSPPAPDFWMHQLKHVTNGPLLDAAVFGERLAQTVAGAPASP